MIGLYIIAAHMAGDYLFQSSWIAVNKLHDRWARTTHVAVYSMCFVPVVWLSGASYNHGVAFLAALAATHYVIDSRRWRTSNPWPAMPILHDQSLHAVQLAVLGGLFLT